RLLEMFGKGDPAGVESTAHRMKGSSMMIGAKHLADACGIIEESARGGDMAGAVRAKEALDEAMDRFEAFLADEMQGSGR
ncbi:MAG: Hpt domain-containing protein, partial [Burkholderiales bacterium]